MYGKILVIFYFLFGVSKYKIIVICENTYLLNKLYYYDYYYYFFKRMKILLIIDLIKKPLEKYEKTFLLYLYYLNIFIL